MKKVFYLILIMLFCNCKREKELSATITKDYKKGSVSNQSNSNIDSVKLGINFTKKGSYAKIKAAIQTNHSFFKTLYAKNKTKAIDSASKYVYTTLIDTIVPHWYNTPWDFNGHTDVPNAGKLHVVILFPQR